MPELPEVQTTIDGIKPYLLNKKIIACKVSVKKLRWNLQKNLSKKIVNEKIKKISRRGKYIIISGKNFYLTIHLGMTGTLRIEKENNIRKKHDHFEITLSSNLKLRFNDPRKFGMIFYSHESPLLKNRLLKNLGPEPLNNEFNTDYLFSISRNRKIPVKSLIMNANIVVGIGNIYASESLFLSKIKPQKSSKTLTKNNCKDLVASIKKVLKKAIKKGGSSINDYINVDGEKGYFQFDFKVYGRTSLPCHICQSDILQIKINQRSTFYCKNCQK
jgi:formamidopyrimidine-DNA glycosylase